MSSVTYEHVSKHFGPESSALQDLCLSIESGEFMVLVGPSGCGKTTALRLLAGLDDVSDGVIRIGDQVINDLPCRDRDIAMVFQSYALYPHMTVFENMAFGLRIRKVDKAAVRAQVVETAETLGLGSLLKRKPRQLSGGQRQRVALGRAIVRHPQVFLLDEPLSNLDAALRVETRFNLKEIHDRLGVTFIYVTHDQVEAMTMGDRIAVMTEGTLQQCASPEEIYNQPTNMYVAGFIGSPQMNFVSAAVEDRMVRTSGFSFAGPYSFSRREITLGIRPEHLVQCSEDGQHDLEIVVDVVEMLGSDQLVRGSAGSDRLIARVNPDYKVGRGDRLRLRVDRSHLHFFDPESQERLIPDGSRS